METGALTRERGAYRLARPIQAIEVPATVQVILAARIDRLPADDKLLLQTASVIGKDVPFLLLHAVAEVPEDAVQRGLTHLQAAEFLYETRLSPDPEYTFKHALTHEVTYSSLLQDWQGPARNAPLRHGPSPPPRLGHRPSRSQEPAEDHYHEALAIAEELGIRPLVAHCHLGLGKLYRRARNGQQAQEHLTSAETMYREMDMRFWLEKAEAELRRR